MKRDTEMLNMWPILLPLSLDILPFFSIVGATPFSHPVDRTMCAERFKTQGHVHLANTNLDDILSRPGCLITFFMRFLKVPTRVAGPHV